MVRKTREQVWRELDDLGEEEVRKRLAAQPGEVGEADLVREWLDQKAPVAAELASTRLDPRTVGIMGLFLLGMLYTLYFAKSFLLPITIATLLNFLLSPAVRGLKRLRLPEPVGAALVVLGLLGLSGVGAYEIAGPAQEWLAKGPASLSQARAKLGVLRRPFERVTHTGEQVEQAARGGGEQPPEVVVRGPTFGARLFGATQSVLTAALGIVILLYFLLATGDLFLLKLVRVLPQFSDKRKAVSIMKKTEASISRYLVTVVMVNLGEGIVVVSDRDAQRGPLGGAGRRGRVHSLRRCVDPDGHPRPCGLGDLRSCRAGTAGARCLPRRDSAPVERGDSDGLGAPARAESRRHLHRSGVLAVDLGTAWRLHRRPGAVHAQNLLRSHRDARAGGGVSGRIA
jgi:hypothetical protein